MPFLVPVISPAVFALRPDFKALSIVAEGLANVASAPAASAALVAACAAPCDAGWAEAHREAWRAAYRAFGAKPQRTPPSSEALLKRVLRDGALPPVNAIVDLYNAVSLRYALPVGGEDAATYVGAPCLVRAVGTERFDTMQNGVAQTEMPEPGEVVWRDDIGVTCRRWNWRQGTRTRIETSTTRAWFILEALGPMPEEALLRAGEELASGLRALSPGAGISSQLINAARQA